MKTRRYLAWIVTALLLLTSFALPAPQAAAEAEAMSLDYLDLSALAAQETPALKENQTKGQCGPNLYWSFDPSTGTLSITGSGYMYEYGPDAENPWVKNGISAEIKSVSLPKGITEIDAYGFFGCEALTSVELPNTVKVIGEGAFKQCANLRTITLSKKVTTINASAFEGCANLKEVRYQGQQDDRVKIRILQGNEPLLKANWHYTQANSAALAIKTHPRNVTVKEGATATFKVKVTGATTIRWQYRKPYETTWYDTGITSTSLLVRGSYSVNGYYFRCKVSNGYTTLYSNAAQLTVKLVPLAIKTHPKTIKANFGKTVTFKVKATGASHYEWQVKFPNDSSWLSLENTNTPSISLTVNRSDYDGLQFRCIVSNDRGDVMYSNAGKLCIKIKVTQKPKTVKVAEGELAKFSVAGTGYTGIQWQYMFPGQKYWSNLDVTSESFSIRASKDLNKLSFRAALYNNTSVKYTSKAKLMVVPAKLSITSHPQSVTVYEGETARFSVSATGATNYQWQVQIPGNSSWVDLEGITSTGISLTAKLSYNGYRFRCKVSNSSSTLYSNAATLTVKQQATDPDPTGTYRALLIGENDYVKSPLKGCVNDMNAMAGMLQGLGNSFSTKTLPNSTKSEIKSALSTVFAGATDSSVSLLYYSGHGVLDEDNPTSQYQGALCPIDCDKGYYITFSELASMLSQVKGRVIIMLDSCHSGAAIGKSNTSRQELEQQIKAYNQAAIAAFSGYRIAATEEEVAKYGELATSKFIVITAATTSESSWDGSFDGSDYRQGRFTAAVIKGLGCKYPNGTYSGSMPADSNGDKKITLSELYKYAYNTALNWGSTAQHAQYYGPDSEVLFSR